MDFIRGEKFIGIADFTFAPNTNRDDDYTHLRNTLDLSKVKDDDVIYTHTFYVHDLFELLKDFDKVVKVVTHNCDMNVDFAPPDCVKMWFSQNVNIIHPRVQSIPIGLQNTHWNKYGDKDAMILEQLSKPRIYKNLIYVNHNVATNPAKREGIYELFEDKPWATVERRNKNFARMREYYKDIYEHKIVLCPSGNGLDTHRFWETLYMGSVPFVECDITHELLYSYFPSISPPLWKSWQDVSQKYLENELDNINIIKKSTDIHNEMLSFEYWKNKILTA